MATEIRFEGNWGDGEKAICNFIMSAKDFPNNVERCLDYFQGKGVSVVLQGITEQVLVFVKNQ